MSIDLHLITAILYGLASALAWLARPGAAAPANALAPTAHTAPTAASGGGLDTSASLGQPTAPPGLATPVAVLTLAAIALHGWCVVGDLATPRGFNLSFATAVSLILALTLMCYAVLAAAIGNLSLVARCLAPAALVAVLLPLLLPAQQIVPYGHQPWFKLHFVVAILGYVLFTVAALHALLMAFMEARLRAGDLPDAARGLPSLMAMETLLFRLLLAAFVLLTLTLATGVVFSEAMFGKSFRFNHKTVFAALSWGIFAWLLYGHWRFGWRGKKAVRLTLIGFGLLLLAYVGTKFVLEILLGRI